MEGEHWMDIRSDRQKGLSYTEIACKYHIDPRTAKKYAQSDTRPRLQGQIGQYSAHFIREKKGKPECITNPSYIPVFSKK